MVLAENAVAITALLLNQGGCKDAVSAIPVESVDEVIFRGTATVCPGATFGSRKFT